MIKTTLIFFILISLISVSIKAQDFELDTTFNANYNFYSQSNAFHPIVYNLLESPSNELYVSGHCYNTSNQNTYTLLKFNSDGNFDYSFQPSSGFSIRLHDFKFQGDLLCSVGRRGTMWPDYHRYDETGSIINNSWSQNFHNVFYWPDSQDGYLCEDGKILFVGAFELTSSPSTKYDIIRINENGLPDTTLMADVYSGGSEVIWNVEPYNNNKLMVFGRWNSWLGDYSVEDGLRRIHLPSCTIDTSFQNILESVPDSGFYSWLNDIYVLNDGKVIITGKFKIKGINQAQGIARLNSDGSLDNTFNNSNNLSDLLSPINIINTISLLHDSSGYLIGGFFESYQGYERHCIVKTDLNGFIDPNFLTGLGIDTISYFTGSGPTDHSWGVTQILPTSDGKYYIGGQIDGFNGVTTQPVFRIQPTPYNIVDESVNSKLKIYPNPANKQIYVDGLIPGSTIQIYTLEGRLIKRLNCERDIQYINVEAFQSGIYFMKISKGNEVFNSKLVISK